MYRMYPCLYLHNTYVLVCMNFCYRPLSLLWQSCCIYGVLYSIWYHLRIFLLLCCMNKTCFRELHTRSPIRKSSMFFSSWFFINTFVPFGWHCISCPQKSILVDIFVHLRSSSLSALLISWLSSTIIQSYIYLYGLQFNTFGSHIMSVKSIVL